MSQYISMSALVNAQIQVYNASGTKTLINTPSCWRVTNLRLNIKMKKHLGIQKLKSFNTSLW